MLAFNLNAEPAIQAMLPYLQRAEQLQPALAEIGEELIDSTMQRFVTATGPDGVPWAPNSPVTLAAYVRGFGRSLRSKEGLNTKGTAKLAGKKPLTGESRSLGTTINYQVVDSQTLHVGSPMIYAPVQQFGAQSGELGFGVYRTREGSFPIPWGDIPARPFLGASATDRATIADILSSYLMDG